MEQTGGPPEGIVPFPARKRIGDLTCRERKDYLCWNKKIKHYKTTIQ